MVPKTASAFFREPSLKEPSVIQRGIALKEKLLLNILGLAMDASHRIDFGHLYLPYSTKNASRNEAIRCLRCNQDFQATLQRSPAAIFSCSTALLCANRIISFASTFSSGYTTTPQEG